MTAPDECTARGDGSIGRAGALTRLCRSRGAAAVSISASSLFFAGKLFWFIDRTAVNLIFWDEYDFLRPLRTGASWWELFSWTHGPHRMGLGFFFIAPVFAVSRWDTRAESFAMGAIFLVTLAVALFLKHRATGRLTVLDACIPALILTTAQFETLAVTVNPAHGPIPLLLVTVAPLCWIASSRAVRILLGGALALAAAFTGFALFLVPLLAVLFVLDAVRSSAREDRSVAWHGLGAVLCVGAVVLFFHGYRFASAASCFRFPDPEPLEYLPFVGLVVLRPMRFSRMFPGAPLLGMAGFAFAAAATAFGAALVLRRERTLLARTIFIFSAFTFMFAVHAAIGRVCLGEGAALSSRYVPYALPLWLAAWFALSSMAESKRTLRWTAGLFCVAVVAIQALVPDDRAAIRRYSAGKRRWRACFLATGDETGCNRSTSFRVYPTEGAPQVIEMMEFLRRNHLNLFKQ